ncbi:MAG: glycosyltransferase family 2 protein [Oscillospiraceae bacterium]|nr:glycosyltransferase family 2 protein [Oscillospiraceae bacterium]
MALITVMVPCYNEEQALPFFYKEICLVASQMCEGRQPRELEFELIFVDDGSTDNTLAVIKEYAAEDKRVRFISFSRNFGKEAAIYAGLLESRGDYVALMDADLQDPPSLLPDMYNIITNSSNNIDCVATRRVTRKGEPVIRSFFARMFYRMINKISKTEIVDGARDFRLMSGRMVDAILHVTEYNRFSKGIFSWVGFNTEWLEYENISRVAGQTKWSFWKLFVYSIDGVLAFSTVPLAIASFIGLSCCLIAFLFIIFVIIRAAVWGDPVAGWPSTICIILLLGGIQLLGIGILGQYLAKAYLETKRRPVYIVRETEQD